jgi:hypothetical protein
MEKNLTIPEPVSQDPRIIAPGGIPLRELELTNAELSPTGQLMLDSHELPPQYLRNYEGYLEMLQRYEWQWFGVLTFDQPTNEQRARRAFRNFERIFFYWAISDIMHVAVLDQIGGNFHIHFLAQKFRNDFPGAYWHKYYGWCWIVLFKNTLRGQEYLASKLARNPDYLIIPN